jgi:hypothetical protein
MEPAENCVYWDEYDRMCRYGCTCEGVCGDFEKDDSEVTECPRCGSTLDANEKEMGICWECVEEGYDIDMMTGEIIYPEEE